MLLALARANVSVSMTPISPMSPALARPRARRDNPMLRWTHSSARLERLPHMQEVPGSSPGASTKLPRSCATDGETWPRSTARNPLALFGTSGLSKILEGFLVVWMPARQSGAVFDDVAGGPKDSTFILLAGRFVVLAKDIKVAPFETLEQPFGDLIGRPCGGGSLGCSLGHVTGIGKARNKEVCTDLAIRKITERMGQPFGQRFHGGFTHIVGGVSGRRSNTLLGTGIYDEALFTPVNHSAANTLNPV